MERTPGISVEASVPANSSFTAAHVWLLACQTQIIANIVQVTVTIIIITLNILTVRLAQFAFVLFTMAKEERVKESGGRGLPLSLQSLQGGSTVDTGKNICGYKKYLQMIHLETERRFSQDDPRNIYKASLP